MFKLLTSLVLLIAANALYGDDNRPHCAALEKHSGAPQETTSSHDSDAQLRGPNLSDALVTYLGRKDATPACIDFALVELGNLKDPNLGPVLARFLDFVEPPVLEPGKQRYRYPMPSFPASEGLVAIGPPAVPSILKYLEGKEVSRFGREMAALTLRAILHDEIGAIRVINDHNRSLKDYEAAANVLEAARVAAGICHPERRAACEAVLYDQSKK